MAMSRIYQSPDGKSLAIENGDGEFTELYLQPWGAWQAQGLLEVVPDSWVRLGPLEDSVREFWREARSTPVEASLDELSAHHTEGGAP